MSAHACSVDNTFPNECSSNSLELSWQHNKVWQTCMELVLFIPQENSDHDINSAQFVNLSGNVTAEPCNHNMKQKYISICISSRSGKEQASIDPLTYRGSVCWEELNSLKNCLLEDGNKQSHPLVMIIDSEGDAKSALSAVDMFASPECAAEVKPFLCLYFFGLMSDTPEYTFSPLLVTVGIYETMFMNRNGTLLKHLYVDSNSLTVMKFFLHILSHVMKKEVKSYYSYDDTTVIF